jgi:hypothetical protein
MNKGLQVDEDAEDTRGADVATFLPEASVCLRYGVSDMTLCRWSKDESLGFPKPIYIKGRKYRRLVELVAFEEKQARDPQVTRWTPRGCIKPDGEAA